MHKWPDAPLYMWDGSHPTAEGSYLAACTIYIRLFGDDPRGLRAPTIDTGEPMLPQQMAEFLQRIAWETCHHTTAPTRPSL